MALDGIFLNVVARELIDTALNARVEKIYQPSKEEIIISLRTRGVDGAANKSCKLLLCANANNPRIHFTSIAPENPQSPPMFCMLMRKHVNTGRLVAVRQMGLDRVLALDFEAVNELGDIDTVSVYIEIMGRHSNIIIVGSDGKIVDSIKRVTHEVSSVRLVLPGVRYQLPPAQDKVNVFENEITADQFMAASSTDVAKSLLATYEGFSPLLAREVAYAALKGQDIDKDRLSDFYKAHIVEELNRLKQSVLSGKVNLTVCVDDSIKLRDFTVMDIEQYGSGPQKLHKETPSELLDWFYAERDQQSRMKQRANDLLKLLFNANERITRKLALQRNELLECANRDKLKVQGDLINANLYRIEKGQREAVIENFYEEGCPEVTISLDARLNPAQNAQRYYNEYKKAQTAEQMLTELIERGEQELNYLDSVYDALSRTNGDSELLEIREELAEQGYIRHTKQRSRMLKAQPPLKYRSSDGFSILCGRNNKQNDKLTLKTARGSDMWLHTQGIAGSHVIIEADGKTISDQAITEAAIIAAYNSKGRSSAQVPVDYTLIKYVKKPNGAKPGMVIFTDYKTAYVTPDSALVEGWAQK